METKTFRVGLTRDFMKADGSLAYGDIGLSALDAAKGVTWDFIQSDSHEISPEIAAQYDALIVLGRAVTRKTVQSTPRLCIVSRFGVGYDEVDVPACTDNGVILSTTIGASTRPVSTIALLYILATSHKLMAKDRIARSANWAERAEHMGVGLTGKTLCIVGFGNIGRDLAKLVQPLEMKLIAVDPYARREDAAKLGVTLTDMEPAMKTADFVVVTAALTPETRGLIGEKEFGLMKPSAFFINVARGPIADQKALTRALSEKRIAGAGMDVFENEPADPKDPIFKLGNVITSPHALAWTDEAFKRVGDMAVAAVLDVAAGRLPKVVVNRDVAGNQRLKERLAFHAAGTRA